jgi:hypothetical protein
MSEETKTSDGEDKMKLSRGNRGACFEKFTVGGLGMLFASVSALVYIVGVSETNYYRAEITAYTGIYEGVPGYAYGAPLFDYQFQLGLQEFCTDLTVFGPLFRGSGIKTCKKELPSNCQLQWSYFIEKPAPAFVVENFTLFNGSDCTAYKNTAALVIAALVFVSISASIQIWLSVKDSFNRLCIGFALISLLLSFLLGVISTGVGASITKHIIGPRALAEHALMPLNLQIAGIYTPVVNDTKKQEYYDSLKSGIPESVINSNKSIISYRYSESNVHAFGSVIAAWVLALVGFFLYGYDLWRNPPALREAQYHKEQEAILAASAGHH